MPAPESGLADLSFLQKELESGKTENSLLPSNPSKQSLAEDGSFITSFYYKLIMLD